MRRKKKRRELRAELARCNREVLDCLRNADGAARQEKGWLVGISDWMAERELVEKELEGMDQEEYLEILFGDLGYNRLARNAFLSEKFGRQIRFLDEMNSREKSEVISELAARRDAARPAPRDDRGDFDEHESRWTRADKGKK